MNASTGVFALNTGAILLVIGKLINPTIDDLTEQERRVKGHLLNRSGANKT